MSEEIKSNSKNREKTRVLCECAIMLALSIALSFFSITPGGFGGSITPASMLPVLLVGIRHGYKWGIGTAFIFSIFQLVTGLSYFSYIQGFSAYLVCLLFDFIIPFTLLGLSAFASIKNKREDARLNVPKVIITSGVLMVMRFLCHFVSGVTIWRAYADEVGQSPFVYSLLYNVVYMLPEIAITLSVLGLFVGSGKIRELITKK